MAFEGTLSSKPKSSPQQGKDATLWFVLGRAVPAPARTPQSQRSFLLLQVRTWCPEPVPCGSSLLLWNQGTCYGLPAKSPCLRSLGQFSVNSSSCLQSQIEQSFVPFCGGFSSLCLSPPTWRTRLLPQHRCGAPCEQCSLNFCCQEWASTLSSVFLVLG